MPTGTIRVQHHTDDTNLIDGCISTPGAVVTTTKTRNLVDDGPLARWRPVFGLDNRTLQIDRSARKVADALTANTKLFHAIGCLENRLLNDFVDHQLWRGSGGVPLDRC